MRLKDKVAIITAAGSGAGRAGAIIFAREGEKVAGGDIDSEGGQETGRRIQKAGGEAASVQVDCGQVKEMKRLVDAALQAYGKLNILWK